MDKSIGNTIQILRKQKGMTQADLASAVGVSTPAVSKWERNLSLPDVLLLAPLARCLGVTIDDLFSFNPHLSDEEAVRIREKCENAFGQSFEKGMELCNRYLCEYPNDPQLSFLLAGLIQNCMYMASSEEEAKALFPKITKLYEIAAEENGEYKEAAGGILIALYTMDGQLDRAESLAQALPEGFFTKNKSLVPILKQQGKFDEAEKLDQHNLHYALHDASSALTGLAGIASKQKRYDDAILFNEKIIELAHLFQIEKSSGLFTTALFEIAGIYALKGDDENALNYIEKFVRHFPDDEETNLSDNLFFCKLHTSKRAGRAEPLRTAWRKILLDTEAFKTVKEHPRFCAVIEQLTV